MEKANVGSIGTALSAFFLPKIKKKFSNFNTALAELLEKFVPQSGIPDSGIVRYCLSDHFSNPIF